LIFLAGCSGGSTHERTAAEAPAARAVSHPTPDPLVQDVPPTRPLADAEDRRVVHRYTEMLYDGELDALFEKFSPEFRETMPRDRLTVIHAAMGERFGKEIQLLGEETANKGEYRAFARWARFDKAEDVVEVQWILRPDDTIAGLFIQPAPKRVQTQQN